MPNCSEFEEALQEFRKALGEEHLRTGTSDQPYRITILGMGKLVDAAPESVALARAFKRAIDPDGILAPGKYGV